MMSILMDAIKLNCLSVWVSVHMKFLRDILRDMML
jgi:hypothetical protein